MGHSGNGCVLASTLCKYDLRKGDLFVLGWAKVRQVLRGNISSELLMCGGGVCSILSLPLVAICCSDCDPCTVACVCAARVTGDVSGRGVVAVSAYMGGTRGSGVLSSAGDVLEMSVVGVIGGVCVCV